MNQTPKEKINELDVDKITFRKVSLQDKDIIFRWLGEPHVSEFWDNSQAHKDDIINFMQGRKEPSNYAKGRFVYWVGLYDGNPFSLIMTIREYCGEDREAIKNEHLSRTGATYGIDYMIGEKAYFGKGLGAATLAKFTDFFQNKIDHNADTFFIDPDVSNPRAKHVYEQAGFKWIGDFVMGGTGVFRGHPSHFLVKKIPLKAELIEATLTDYPTIQNLARFYVYDLSRSCGFISEDWSCPSNGLYADKDLKEYFEDPNRCAFLIKVGNELAGFVLLHHVISDTENYWVLAEFFVVAKYQKQGIGVQVASLLWKTIPAEWQLTVIPENREALSFWRRTISTFTSGNYTEEVKEVDYDKNQTRRYILSFDSKTKGKMDARA